MFPIPYRCTPAKSPSPKNPFTHPGNFPNHPQPPPNKPLPFVPPNRHTFSAGPRSEEHTSELQSLRHLVCRLLLEKIYTKNDNHNFAELLFSTELFWIFWGFY